MGSRLDNSGRALAAYLNRCYAARTRPTLAGAKAFAAGDVPPATMTLTWKRYERMGFLRKFDALPVTLPAAPKKSTPKKSAPPPKKEPPPRPAALFSKD
jgi:hypothetical protein